MVFSLSKSVLSTLTFGLASSTVLALVPPLKRADTATPIPDYALTYAPYTYLYSEETYWPSDISTHLQHVTPQVDFKNVADSVTFDSIGALSNDTYLTSKDNVTDVDQPQEGWLLSDDNKPGDDGSSAAPATIICSNKANGTVDCFYFYFYSYDLGNTFADIRFGNHIGDWEHSMVRFISEKPAYIYLSAHSAGTAYNYTALDNESGRAVTYVAKGTHANYATSGEQKYPSSAVGPIADHTDKGPFWDVTKNYRGYWYDVDSKQFTVAGGAGLGANDVNDEGLGWLNFLGMWGDQQPEWKLTNNQYCIGSECHYVSGPTGPIDKNLGRTEVCQDENSCDISDSL